jgi:nucleoside-diphosphate-sugar epimerase
MTQRILVTGGAGYIGSILVEELLREGYKVIVLDNFMYNQTSLLHLCHNTNLSVVRGSAGDVSLIKKIVNEVDIIIPLACIVGASACDANKNLSYLTNVKAIELINHHRGTQQVIFPNTNSGYGIGEDDIFCTEETPLNPISEYGKQKVLAERELLDKGNAVVLRLATVFGISPRMRLDLLVNDFVYRALNDRFIILFESHFKRNFIHVKDVARAFLHCIENYHYMKNEAYNLGLSNANLSKKELCEEIKKQLPDFYFVNAEIGEDPDKRNYIVSNKKIEAAGFKARVSLEKGITELIKGYQVINRNQFSNT